MRRDVKTPLSLLREEANRVDERIRQLTNEIDTCEKERAALHETAKTLMTVILAFDEQKRAEAVPSNGTKKPRGPRRRWTRDGQARLCAFMTEHPGPQRLARIMRETGLSQSTVYRYTELGVIRKVASAVFELPKPEAQ